MLSTSWSDQERAYFVRKKNSWGWTWNCKKWQNLPKQYSDSFQIPFPRSFLTSRIDWIVQTNKKKALKRLIVVANSFSFVIIVKINIIKFTILQKSNFHQHAAPNRIRDVNESFWNRRSVLESFPVSIFETSRTWEIDLLFLRIFDRLSLYTIIRLNVRMIYFYCCCYWGLSRDRMSVPQK